MHIVSKAAFIRPPLRFEQRLDDRPLLVGQVHPRLVRRVDRNRYEKTSKLTLIGGKLTQCDPFGIPSTSHWTGAAIIVQESWTKTCIVTRPRTSSRLMPSSLVG